MIKASKTRFNIHKHRKNKPFKLKMKKNGTPAEVRLLCNNVDFSIILVHLIFI